MASKYTHCLTAWICSIDNVDPASGCAHTNKAKESEPPQPAKWQPAQSVEDAKGSDMCSGQGARDAECLAFRFEGRNA